MNTKQAEYVVFDVETTGLFPQRGDRIVEIAFVRVKNWEIVDSFESLIALASVRCHEVSGVVREAHGEALDVVGEVRIRVRLENRESAGEAAGAIHNTHVRASLGSSMACFSSSAV